MKPLDNRNNNRDIRATSRADRSHAALRPAYFRVDERTPQDLVEFAAKYFRLIAFHNSQGRIDGDWSPFFENDPVVALFLIRSYTAKGLRKKYAQFFRKLSRSVNAEYREETLKKITQDILTSLRKTESYFVSVAPFRDFHLRFGNLIRLRLSKVLAQFVQIESVLAGLDGAPGKKPQYNYRQEFSPEWFEAEVSSTLPEQKEELLLYLTRAADEQVYNLFYSLKELRADAGDYLDKQVKESGEIKAHIALLLTFFDLFRLAQDKLNTFTGRHLDYYYDSVLNIRKLGRTYGEAYVVMKLAEAAPEQELKAGTLFPAGTGKNGEDLLYALKEPLIVNAATIQRMIGVECNHAWEEKSLLPEQPFPFKSYFQAGPGHLPSFPKDVNVQSQGFGFAASAKILAQPEGDRKFSFCFTFTHESFREFLSSCRNVLEERKPHENEYEAARPEIEKLNDLLRNTLKISCSVPDGWHEIPAEKADFFFGNFSDCRLQIDVLLETSAPPVGPVADETYAHSFAQQLPVFRFLLHNDLSPVYTLLRLPVIEKTVIETEVNGIRNLLLRNDFGPVVPGAPFEMFGPQPRPGASFFVGHPALLYPLYDLRVTLEWSGLPVVSGGFAEHYRGYDYIRDNSTFKALVSTLRSNRWMPPESRPMIDLFQDAPGGDKSISRITRLNNFDLDTLELDRPEAPLTGPGPFTGTDIAGFIRLEFCYPPNGFGHADYPGLINKVSQEMSRRKKEIVPLPNEPYTPTLKNVLLDFKTRQEIHFGEDGNYFYQLYPYGKESCGAGIKRLLPFFNDGSTLLIGFGNVEDNSTLSLLTKINDSVSAVAPGIPEVRWSLLERGEWITLSPKAFISDETSKLKRTGITRFMFPDITTGDGLLHDPSLTWLKAESINGVPFLPLIAQLYTQAGTIHLHSGEPAEAILPAFSVKALADNNAAIEFVMQPYPSAGDRPEEEHEDWHCRISERLRHRGRAITSWDYEHLTLQEFPEVQMAKCISHVSGSNLKAPGNVIVAVLPSTDHTGDLSRQGLFTLEKLEKIAVFLEKIAPGGVKVSVQNPQYEKIRVKLRVKFAEGYDEVFYSRQLDADISSFLDPWKEGSGLQARFGVSVSGFTILNYIENLYYVEFATNFNVFHVVKDKVINLGSMAAGVTEIVPSTPVSILISDRVHIINLFDGTTSDSGGLNEMMIGTDFMMNADQELETGVGVNFGKIGKDLFVTGEEEKKPVPAGTKFKMKINV